MIEAISATPETVVSPVPDSRYAIDRDPEALGRLFGGGDATRRSELNP